MGLIINKIYPVSFSGYATNSTVVIGFASLPWDAERVGRELALGVENQMKSKGFILLRQKVWVDWVWLPFPQFQVKVECTLIPTTALTARKAELVVVSGTVAIILALAALATVIGIVYWLIRQADKPQRIAQFYCSVCGAGPFGSASELDAHMEALHGIKQYTCPFCGARFDTSAELQSHIASAHPENQWQEMIKWIAIAGMVGIGGIVAINYLKGRK